jgi:hypothetical protein
LSDAETGDSTRDAPAPERRELPRADDLLAPRRGPGTTPVWGEPARPAEPPPDEAPPGGAGAATAVGQPAPPPPGAEPAEPWGAGRFATIPPVEAFEGARQVRQYIEDGYELYLVAGVGGVGKTELLHSSRQRAFLSSFDPAKRKAGRSLPTAPGRLDTHPLAVGRRKVVFIDASGEHFARLYPELQQSRQVTREQVGFLELVSRNLSGVVLLLEAGRRWNGSDLQDARQEEILAWILQLLRWLRGGGRYREDSSIGFQEQVDREVKTMRRRLQIPVLVLLSKADELNGLTLPPRPEERWFAGAGETPLRRLYPLGESPLLLAFHRLPTLWQGLTTHVKHFRVDFAHSLTVDPDTGVVDDASSNGLVYSLGWLLQPWWRWVTRPQLAPFFLGTRRWVALARAWDRLTRRGERWRRLPEPEPFRP